MVLMWLVPLGFLGLLGIIVLLLIYLLKPKYQQKVVSSTFVWKLALNYRKRRIPIDPFRNLLVFLCQALFLTACSLLLAQPFLFSEDAINAETEQIIILDASASMRAETAGTGSRESRFDRAVKDIRLNMDKVLFDNNGILSIILADKTPHFIVESAGKNEYSRVVDALDEAECSSFHGDVEGALNLAQEKLRENPAAKIIIYSGTEYGDLGDAVTVNTLADPETEWNIALESCTAAIEENEYVFYIDIAAYGEFSSRRDLYVSIKGVENGDGERTNLPDLKIPVTFGIDSNIENKSSRQSLKVRATDPEIGGNPESYFSSFEEVIVEFRDLNDSIPDDDIVHIYGGLKDEIKIQYYSSDQNSFFYLGFHILVDNMSKTRDIYFKQVYHDEEPEIEGFDYYIFEHSLPEKVLENGLPTDGVIILWDPDQTVANLGLELGEEVQLPEFTYLSGESDHPLMQYVNPTRLGISKYRKINEIRDDGFETLMTCNGDPVLLAKNRADSKIVVLPFSINQSNVSYFRDFETLLYNLINYYMPITLTKYAFELEDSTEVKCKGQTLYIESESGKSQKAEQFPYTVTFNETGTYTFTTKFGYQKDDEVRKVFVRISPTESSLFEVVSLNMNIQNGEVTGVVKKDLLVYFAAVIVALLFVEWWLQFKDIV